MGHKIDTVLQKLKPEEKAKNFVRVLLHAGSGIVLASATATAIIQIASHFSEKAGEMVGKLGGEQRLHLALGALALASAAIGMVYFALYLTTKTDKQLKQDNETLKAGIDYVAKADEASTDLAQIKTNKIFTDAKEIAQA